MSRIINSVWLKEAISNRDPFDDVARDLLIPPVGEIDAFVNTFPAGRIAELLAVSRPHHLPPCIIWGIDLDGLNAVRN